MYKLVLTKRLKCSVHVDLQLDIYDSSCNRPQVQTFGMNGSHVAVFVHSTIRIDFANTKCTSMSDIKRQLVFCVRFVKSKLFQETGFVENSMPRKTLKRKRNHAPAFLPQNSWQHDRRR